jgi:hypothetical protein
MRVPPTPSAGQHTAEGNDKQEHKYRDHDDQHTPILLSDILSTHTMPFYNRATLSRAINKNVQGR